MDSKLDHMRFWYDDEWNSSIRNLRQRFQATGRTKDVLRSWRPRVMAPSQDRYIMNTQLRNRFQTVTATAANAPCTHDNRISSQTLHNRLREGGIIVVVLVLAVSWRNVTTYIVLTGQVHMIAG